MSPHRKNPNHTNKRVENAQGKHENRSDIATLVRDSTDKNRQFFALHLGIWVYVLFMVFSTTDQMLLIPTQPVKLPIVDISLPLIGFYLVAPLLLFIIHANLLQNLESHHYKLMCWLEAHGGEEVPRKEVPAFLFDFATLEHGSILEFWVQLGYRFLFFGSGPFALGLLLWRFTDYQSIRITSWHFLLFIMDSYLVYRVGIAFKNNKKIPLAKQDKQRAFSALDLVLNIENFIVHLFETAHKRPVGLLVLLQVILACWYQWASDSWWDKAKDLPFGIFNNSQLSNREYYPLIPSYFTPVIVIAPNETVWLPDKKEIEIGAFLSNEKDLNKWWSTFGEGLNLRGRHLRGFSAKRAVLPKLQLDYSSDLRGANLAYARLEGGNFEAAQLSASFLGGALLQRANLSFANLQGVDLSGAELKGGNLMLTNLQDSKLTSANLQETNLTLVQLQRANLTSAKLQGADIEKAQLENADLTNANLQGLDLKKANLKGANLTNALLQ